MHDILPIQYRGTELVPSTSMDLDAVVTPASLNSSSIINLLDVRNYYTSREYTNLCLGN